LSWLSGSLLDLRWKAVRLAQERIEILESITDGFAALDNKQRFIYLNSTAARLIGAAISEVLGKNVWEVVPDWKESTVQSGCRDASERQVPIRLEYQSRSSAR
jgi:PAS domain S-box-containing protein